MAIRGNAYPKTSWAFQERPVTASKLNTWDDRIESALELAFHLLSYAWGGGDGVLRNIAGELETVALDTPGLSVRVNPGFAFIQNHVYKLAAQTQTPDIAAPITNDRIDLVQARLDTWDIAIKTGAESPTPTDPTPDDAAIPLAHIYCRPAMTSIKNADDATNAYLIDARTFL